MTDFLRNLFNSSDFMARQHCGIWTEELVWLHVGSDVVTGFCYTAIPFLLVFFARKKKDAPFANLFWWFAAFIVFCGITHFMEAYMFWNPVYRLSGVIKLCTAVVSTITLGLLVSVIPQALAMKTPQKFEHEIAERKKAETQLRELNETLELRVAERTQELAKTTRDLQELNDALLASNQALDEFAGIVSHDLKEPLRGISNYTGFVLEDCQERLNPEDMEKLSTIGSLAKRMEAQISSLHEYSRVGSIGLARKPTDIRAVVDQVLEGFTMWIQEEQLRVTVADDLPVMTCDGVRVREVFHNLVSNAIKYNDKPTKELEIGWDSSDGNKPIFWVRDNGIGIPERYQRRIFRIFERLHGRDQFGGGTGAGLAIVQKIVQRHGGDIWVDSAEGEGATFYFTLKPVRRSE